MYEFHPYFTNDGSVGLFNTDFDDIYHSATGALTEAYEKFIYPVDFDSLLKKKSIKVLDICYGIGYNTKSFLNFLFENYFLKKFSEKNSIKISSNKYDIEAIHTNNNLAGKEKILSVNNDTIHTNNIIQTKSLDIYIRAIDTDKILSYLSPFVRTGVKNISNQKFNFQYDKINKYLTCSKKIFHPKINPLINYLIFEKIRDNCNDFIENGDVFSILNSKDFVQYFDSNIRGYFNLLRNQMYNKPSFDNLSTILHNIYYRNISNCYKKRLKTYKLQDIDFELKNDDARKIILKDKNLYNLIFLDAFTPSKCPCLWSYEFFKLLFEHLEPDGMILTYSTSASIRNAMQAAGFEIGNIYNERLGKFSGTIATKDKSLIKSPLSEFDLGLLKTKAGIFYRDENLTALNEAILERRNSEVKSSNKMSTSHYNKLYKSVKKV